MRMLSPEGEDTKKTHILGAFLAGGISGSASWLVSYPIDYVKTVIQSQQIENIQYKSAIYCAIKKYKE
jgi:hypothetical protein